MPISDRDARALVRDNNSRLHVHMLEHMPNVAAPLLDRSMWALWNASGFWEYRTPTTENLCVFLLYLVQDALRIRKLPMGPAYFGYYKDMHHALEWLVAHFDWRFYIMVDAASNTMYERRKRAGRRLILLLQQHLHSNLRVGEQVYDDLRVVAQAMTAWVAFPELVLSPENVASLLLPHA